MITTVCTCDNNSTYSSFCINYINSTHTSAIMQVSVLTVTSFCSFEYHSTRTSLTVHLQIFCVYEYNRTYTSFCIYDDNKPKLLLYKFLYL